MRRQDGSGSSAARNEFLIFFMEYIGHASLNSLVYAPRELNKIVLRILCFKIKSTIPEKQKKIPYL